MLILYWFHTAIYKLLFPVNVCITFDQRIQKKIIFDYVEFDGFFNSKKSFPEKSRLITLKKRGRESE